MAGTLLKERPARSSVEEADREATAASRNDESPFAAFLADLEGLGVRPVEAGGLGYGMVRARGNDRWWLIPVDPPAASISGLAMFQPMTLSARLAKAGAGALMRLRLRPLWARDRIAFSGLPQMAGVFDEDAVSCAYFTGTAGPHRKTAVQVMGGKGRILGYGKISRAAAVTRYLANEARALAEVRALGLRSVDAPRCLVHSERRDLSLLVTDSCRDARDPAPKALGAQHLRFLHELAERTERRGATELLAELGAALSDMAGRLPEAWGTRLGAGLARLAPGAAAMRLAMAHGDFTPWNCFVRSDRLYVFDWEYSRPAGPLGHDLVHFRLSSAWPRWPDELAAQVISELAREFHRGDRRAATEALLLSLLLTSTFYLSRAYEAGESHESWTANAHYLTLIDRVLSSLPAPRGGR